MRNVTVRHKAPIGTKDYTIYETVEQLIEDKPDASIAYTLMDAKEGDYVVAENGWVVPLLQTTFTEDKFVRGSNKSKYRKKAWKYKIFIFPKYRKSVCLENLHKAIFNYNPGSSGKIATENKRSRLYELSARKLQWANYVIQGNDYFTAVTLAYPKIRNKNRMLKTLLLNDKLQDYIAERTGTSIKSAYEKAGLNLDYLAKKMKEFIEDKSVDSGLRRIALSIVIELAEKDYLPSG